MGYMSAEIIKYYNDVEDIQLYDLTLTTTKQKAVYDMIIYFKPYEYYIRPCGELIQFVLLFEINGSDYTISKIDNFIQKLLELSCYNFSVVDEAYIIRLEILLDKEEKKHNDKTIHKTITHRIKKES